MTDEAAAAPVRLDARGLRCPWPVLRLARALREADRVVILADDPQAPAEIAAYAAAHGYGIAIGDDHYLIEKGPITVVR